MHAVNKGVRAWNWATGKTKADLANYMLTVAPVLESMGMIGLNPVLGAMASPLYLICSHLGQESNKKQETLEEICAENNLMFDPKDLYASTHKIIGPTWISVGGVVDLEGTVSNNPMYFVLGTGNIVRGFSHYVMRADYLPPRKSIFKRAKEKLTEKLKEAAENSKGGLVPKPQPSSFMAYKKSDI